MERIIFTACNYNILPRKFSSSFRRALQPPPPQTACQNDTFIYRKMQDRWKHGLPIHANDDVEPQTDDDMIFRESQLHLFC